MPTAVKDAATGARFFQKTPAEQKQRDTTHHGAHKEELLEAIVQVLTGEQKAALKKLLKNCPHQCVQRVLKA